MSPPEDNIPEQHTSKSADDANHNAEGDPDIRDSAYTTVTAQNDIIEDEEDVVAVPGGGAESAIASNDDIAHVTSDTAADAAIYAADATSYVADIGTEWLLLETEGPAPGNLLSPSSEPNLLPTFPQFSEQDVVTSLGSSNIQMGEKPCPAGVTMAQIGRLLFVAQRIRYAAFVFLHAMIEFAENTLVDVAPHEWRSLVDSLPYTKTRAVDGCLDMLETLAVGAHCEFAALTLPLFIAGCETNDPRQRYFVLDRLFLLEKSVSIGNIARARDALMMIWQNPQESSTATVSKSMTDRQFWWKVLQEMGWELILS
ncbi:lysine requiring protein [Sporothrix stenoceras]|uniref:Lysine requiring protein n=1 Tax=Sporothrix stenoceras TaxID=5173 RepID=A0ABR3ZGN5_9PEZI